MKLYFKDNTPAGKYPVDVSLYNRSGERLAFDYDNSKKQIYIEDVTIRQAKWMIKSLEEYIRDKEILDAQKVIDEFPEEDDYVQAHYQQFLTNGEHNDNTIDTSNYWNLCKKRVEAISKK